MCPISYALGCWRGRHGRDRAVRLADKICPASYGEGFDDGATERAAARAAAPRRTGHRQPAPRSPRGRADGRYDRRAA